jgi:hypothetical protein
MTAAMNWTLAIALYALALVILLGFLGMNRRGKP